MESEGYSYSDFRVMNINNSLNIDKSSTELAIVNRGALTRQGFLTSR